MLEKRYGMLPQAAFTVMHKDSGSLEGCLKVS
jgi:hypothetical protein